MSRRNRVIRGLWLAALLWGTGALAQGNSVITGTLQSAEDKRPLENVVVTATSPQLQGERTVVTDKSGLYRIPQLPPGTYTLRMEGQGFHPFARTDILLRIDRTIRFNAELVPDAMNINVEVVGTPPSVDVGSSAAGVTVDQEFIRNIAVIRPGTKGSASRSFEGLAELAPGATEDRYGVSISGSSSPESQYVVDGLSVNDPGVGTLGTPLSVEFVKEVNIITGGYMPEYGRSTGGVLNVLTKSGSNEFHGSVFANMAPGAFQTAGKVVRREGSVISAQGSAHNLGDFGFDLGGPLLKDKLWFYVGVAPSFNRIQVDRQLSTFEICTEKDDNGCAAVGARRKDLTTGFSQATPIEGSQVSRFADERSVQYLGKLTYNFNPDHSLAVSVFGTPRSSGGSGKYSFSDDGEPEVCSSLSCTGFVQGAYEAIATRRENSALDLVAKQSSSFFEKKLLVDATLGWHHQADSILPSDGSGLGSGEGLSARSNIAWRRTRNPGPHTINEFETLPNADACGTTPAEQALRCPVTAYSTGGPGTISIQRLDRVQGKVMGTYLLEALGHHILKAGADIERMSFYNNRARTGLTPWQECTGGDCFFSLNQYGYLEAPDRPVFLASKEGTSTSTTVGGFIQDSWSVLDKVTINAGLRYDVQTLYGLDGEVGLHLPNQWSPRLGVIYDPTQAGRAKVFANYARFFENVPLDMADLSFPQQQLLSATYNTPPCTLSREGSLLTECDLDANRKAIGSRESPNQLWDAQGGDRVPVDPQIRAQSADEFVVGGEYELLAASRVGATYTRRYLNDVIEDMSRDDGSTFFLGNPGKGYSTDFPLAKREYDAVNLYFQRAFTNGWLAQASYTWSTLRGNYSGLFRADTGQLSPNLTRDFDLLTLTVNREGQLPGDRTHSFKVFGAKEFVIGPRTSINVGGNYRARSGAPLNYLGANPRRSGSETFILPRGSAGRLPWVHGVDGHVGLNQRLVKDSVLTVSLDVFNLFNFQQYTDVDQTFTTSRVYAIEQGGAPDNLTACLNDLSDNCKVISTTTNARITSQEINPNFKRPTAYQAPRAIRLGAKLSF
ncbi:TonB-dependent receptor domain-containing protein [Corallococcus llansteffanensis]|uniref:TonB-dependent receptor n=1 Tax=Corallococcus llansteffanensis TaxID=2316731 RepID=A0A3A8NJR7_9BACT|nr:TonB-dependent receptor [Corallococcus llansteffanensis]RKH44577.1 TonB-dependent receptor [Corallococcus llansteffanensis]